MFKLEGHIYRQEEPASLAPEVSEWPDLFEAVLNDLHAAGTIFGTPKLRSTAETEEPLPDPDRPAPPIPSFTVEAPVRVSDHHLHVTASVGAVDAHKRFTTPEGAEGERSLLGGSAEVAHRIDFIFPKGEGDVALVNVETVAGRDPHMQLRAHIAHGLKAVQARRKDESRAARALARQERRELPDAPDTRTTTWTYHQVADGAHLERLVATAREAAVTFEEYVPSDRSENAERRRGRVSVALFTEEQRTTAMKIVRKWLRLRDDPPGQAAVVAELAEEFDIDEDRLAEAGVPVNRASLTLSGGEGGDRTITPYTIKEFFTYGIATGPPPMSYFYARVIPKLEDLAKDLAIELPALDPEEVAECLTASTPDPSPAASSEDSGSAEQSGASQPTSEPG